MNDLQIFSNPEFGQVRTVEIDGQPWLVGKDVAVALGYKNPQRAIRDHVEDEDKGMTKTVTPSGEQDISATVPTAGTSRPGPPAPARPTSTVL